MADDTLNLNLLVPGGASGLSDWYELNNSRPEPRRNTGYAPGLAAIAGGGVAGILPEGEYLPYTPPPQPEPPPTILPWGLDYYVIPPEMRGPLAGMIDLVRLTGSDMTPAESVGYGSLGLIPGMGVFGKSAQRAVRGLESLAEQAWQRMGRGAATGAAGLTALGPESAEGAPVPRGFWSVLEDVVRNAPSKVRSAQEWQQYLKPGRTVQRGDVLAPLKKDELQWSDLDRLFKMYPEGPIPRDTVIRTLEERRMPEWDIRQERRMPKPARPKLNYEELERRDRYYELIDERARTGDENLTLSDEQLNDLADLEQRTQDWDMYEGGATIRSGNPQYSQYTTAGPKTGYQENLTKWAPEEADGRREELRPLVDEMLRRNDNLGFDDLGEARRAGMQEPDAWDLSPEDRALLEEYREAVRLATKADKGFTPRAGHFDSEPNVLSHSRASQRTGPNGEKIRYVEEVQSDWHQQARDEGGYRSEDTEEAEEVFNRIRGRLGNQERSTLRDLGWTVEQSIPYWRRVGVMSPEEETVLSNWLAKGKSSSDVPAAPFKDDYAALELKKQLAQAIESGDEFLAWTPGEEQIGRYSGALKQQVDRITWIKNENGTYSVYPIKRGLPVQIEGTENLDAKGLRNLIGKEMADKIMSTEPEMINKAGEVGGELTGDNLTIGGAGMRHFYDTVMRREAEKLAKQYGGELTEASFHNVREPWHIVREDDPNYIVQSFDSKDLADKWLARMHERGVGAVLKVRGVEPLKTPAIRITDKMRENFKKAGGFPLYGVAGAAALAPDDWMSAFEPD